MFRFFPILGVKFTNDLLGTMYALDFGFSDDPFSLPAGVASCYNSGIFPMLCFPIRTSFGRCITVDVEYLVSIS